MITQMKTLHFWLVAAATVVGGLLYYHVVPVGKWFDALTATSLALAYMGVYSAVKWGPPATGAPLELPKPTDPPTIKGTSILLPVIFFSLSMQGCAHVSPATKEWAQNFKSCLIANGLQSLGNEGPQIFNILDSGGSSPGQIEQQIESVLVSSSGAVIEDVAICAVQAWENMHPVPPDAPPTPSQAAARVFVARHAKAPTVKW